MNCNRLILVAVVAFAMLLCGSSTVLAGPSYLGSAQDFAVLGASTVTNSGDTTIYGSVGVDPGSAITGFPPGIVTGGSIYYGPGDPSLSARLDATNAYNTLAGLSGATDLTSQNLGGMVLTPGVYKFTSSAGLTGIIPLTLNFTGNPNADFVFQIGSTLITDSSSVVNVIGGGPLSGVYWQVTSSATLGSDSTFAGNILALASVGLDPGADILCGRAIALTGAVTIADTSKISNNNTAETFGVTGRPDYGSYGFSGGPTVIPAPSAFLLVSSGLTSLFALRRRLLAAV